MTLYMKIIQEKLSFLLKSKHLNNILFQFLFQTMITRIGRWIGGGIKNVAIGSKNKFVTFWTQLGGDYKAALSDLGVVCQKKPIKASFYISCGVILTRLYWTNPTVVNFRQNYIDFHHDLMLGWYFMSCENDMRQDT